MPDLTTNLKLKKPLLDEAADIAVINENMDKIDAVAVLKNGEQAIHHATACTGTGSRYELIIPTLDYPLPSNFIFTFTPHVAVLDNAVVVIRKSAETPNEQSTVLPIKTIKGWAAGANAFSASSEVILSVGGGNAYVADDSEHTIAPASGTQTIKPGPLYNFGSISALNLSLEAPAAGAVCQYKFAFKSPATATALTLPTNVKWVWGTALPIKPSKSYVVAVLYANDEYLAIGGEF